MNRILLRFLSVLVVCCNVCVMSAVTRYVGGDISLLPEYEKAGAEYYDHEGKPIASLLPFLHEEGMNAMRVRLFVDPKAYTGPNADPNACQDLGYILPLCQRIKEAGFALMLDFHYSDTWADPAAQWTPAAWLGQTDDELVVTIADYTRSVLQLLKDSGCMPDFIQPGNEISFGMLWGRPGAPESELKKTFMGNEANWDRLGRLLNSAIGACREVCPQAQIVIHTERVADIPVLTDFYRRMAKMNVDYDIIGLSYYPYFHGNMSILDKALATLSSTFSSRRIMIVETGFPYAWEVPGTNQKVDYPYTEAGQNDFAHELVEVLKKYNNVTGLFWWWLEYNAKGTNLSGWYNAPLFDSRTGKATQALQTICSFAKDASVDDISNDDVFGDDRWFTIDGRIIDHPTMPGLYIHRGKTIVLTPF